MISIGQGKYINKNKSRYVFQSLPWLVIETCGSKLSFIAIAFYRNIAILCAKMSRERSFVNFDPERCYQLTLFGH